MTLKVHSLVLSDVSFPMHVTVVVPTVKFDFETGEHVTEDPGVLSVTTAE